MVLEVLYPTNERSVDANLNLRLDVIAIHGLGGNLCRTWTESKSQKLWLRDFLPGDLPKARIMTFGYNASPALDNSTADIVDHARDLLECLIESRREASEARRPLIFIAHSLGGLVIKQSLILADKEPRFKEISCSTAGIIFFGTPHQGSSLATYALMITKIATVITNKPDPKLLRTLKVGSKVLRDLTEEFQNHRKARSYPTVSFYETKVINGMKNLIVSKASAIMTPSKESSGDENIPVPSNHREMCQFSSEQDQTYKRTVEAIKRIYNYGSEVSLPNGNEHFIVPHTVNYNFTGRNEIRKSLQDKLLPDPHFQGREQPRFVLFGMGGCGKTQLALSFAQDHREKFWGIFWVDGTTKDTADASFLEIARQCRKEQNADVVKAWLSRKEHWLLIIDNVDDPKFDISRMFPSGCHGAILVTARNPDFRQYGSAESYRVDKLSDEDAVTLLIKTARPGDIESVQDPSVRHSAGLVVKQLGNLALAIFQAGAVIRQNICSLNGFCELYSKQKKRTLELGRPTGTDDYQHSVYTTWEISILRIEEMSEVHAAFALELLQLFSFFHFDGIVEDIFKKARNNTDDSVQDHLYTTTSAYLLMQSGWDPLVLAKALKILDDFSLITIDDSRRIAIHPLVHEWSRERMSGTQRAEAWLKSASILSLSIDRGDSAADWQYRRSLLPHIETCLDCTEGRELLFSDGSRLEERLYIATKFARIIKRFGRSKTALNLERQILELKNVRFQEEDPSILGTKSEIAGTLSTLCRYREATELREYLLKVASKNTSNGCLSLSYLKTMEDLAGSYFDIGRFGDAQNMIFEVLTGFKHHFGDEDSRTLYTQGRLAQCFTRLGRYREAALLLEQVLRACQRKLGHTHYWTLGIMDDLATIHYALHRFKKGRQLREQAVNGMKMTLGEDHPNTLLLMSNSVMYGRILWKKKQCKVARKEVLKRMEETLGEHHQYTLVSMDYLARSYFQYGAFEKARQLQQRAVIGMVEVLGESHFMTVTAQKKLAQIEGAQAVRKMIYGWIC